MVTMSPIQRIDNILQVEEAEMKGKSFEIQKVPLVRRKVSRMWIETIFFLLSKLCVTDPIIDRIKVLSLYGQWFEQKQ